MVDQVISVDAVITKEYIDIFHKYFAFNDSTKSFIDIA